MTVPDFATGKVLGGKYTLQTLLRRSPWAATYRATLGPGQEVVVKLLDTALAQQQAALDAILRAGAAVAAVPEPLVCQVVEHGKDPETGALFIVSRVAANPSLASILERGPMPAEAAVALMRSVGQVMDAAHATRLAHLALKPTNIFVGAAPGYPAQIGDFGANATRTLVPDEVRQAFSAPWLAPEQIANDSVAGPSSDVFAAALVAFAALTAGSFWRSCGAAGPDVAAWRAEVIAPPARASQRASDLGVTLGPAFDAVFARALSVPQNRFPSVGELAKALAEAWEASRSSAARSPGQATAPGAGGPAADAHLNLPNTPNAPGLQYAATVPQGSPAAGGALPLGTDPGAAGGVAFAAGAPNGPAEAVAAPGIAGVTAVPADGPKKGSKAWIVIVLGVLVIGGAVGFVLFQRARANALARGAAGIGSDTVATGASAHVPGVASTEPASAAPAGSAGATGSAEPAAVAAETPEGGGGPAAAASTAEPEPVAPATAEPAATATAAAGGAATAPAMATATAVAVAPAQPGDVAAQPKKQNHPAAGTGATGGGPTPAKKPCGKFLERCPDSGS